MNPKNSNLKTLDLSKYPSLTRYKQIYFLGDLSLLNSVGVTIVGSRKMTSYGSRVVEYVVKGLSGKKVYTISGFVEGVDKQVFKESVKNGVGHIICLGYGMQHFIDQNFSEFTKYFKNPDGLAFEDLLTLNKILVLSQFLPNQVPTTWTFPKRDELLASVGFCTLVVEASQKSGTMYTVKRAVKENKKVLTVPGSIFSSTSFGTNSLLNGTELVVPFLNIKSLYNVLNFSTSCKEKLTKQNNTEIELKILNVLNGESLFLDEISKSLKIPVAKLSSSVTMLEINGQLKKSGGKYYRVG